MTERTSQFGGVFQSWNVKLRRADEHLNWIETEFQWFRQMSSYRLASEFDRESRQNVFLVEHMNTIPTKWGAVIGECINGYRSALDHIVYFLAEQRGTATDKTEFPIYVEPEKYKVARHQKIGGLDEPAKAVIDLAQPKARTGAGPTRGGHAIPVRL